MSSIPEGATYEFKDWGGEACGGAKYYRKRGEEWECYLGAGWKRIGNGAEWLGSMLTPINLTSAPAILEAAAGHMKDRAATYDKLAGERSMSATVKAFEAVTGVAITEEQGWLFMVCLKLVRGVSDKTLDSQEDLVAYCALMGECVARERNAKASS